MSDDEAFAFKMGLLYRSLEKIEMSYLRALERGDTDPVVLVLDPREPRARAILAHFDRPARVDALVAEAARREGVVPQVIVGLPRRVVLGVARDHLPALEEAFEVMDLDEGYLVVVVAAGGAAIRVMPPLPA